MKHDSAVYLWNSVCQVNKEQCSEVTGLGCAALAKDVPIYALVVTDYVLAHPGGDYRLNTVKSIAAFLREWADAIERKGQDIL